jgi:hypothetical protein
MVNTPYGDYIMFGGTKTSTCLVCQKQISNNNLVRHEKTCGVVKQPKKVRGVDFDPNIGFKLKTRVAWNKGLSKDTSPAIKKYASTISSRYRSGELKVQGCATWSKEQRRENAKKHKTGGYKPNAGHSKKFQAFDSFGNKVCLQSTYELQCAQILDQLKIKWIRPKFLPYGGKKYYPDFYLVDHDVYLDPKNSYLIKKDASKIQAASVENNVRIVVLHQDQINEQYILGLLI